MQDSYVSHIAHSPVHHVAHISAPVRWSLCIALLCCALQGLAAAASPPLHAALTRLPPRSAATAAAGVMAAAVEESHAACKSGDAAAVQHLLAAEPELAWALAARGRPPLRLASQSGHTAVVR